VRGTSADLHMVHMNIKERIQY